MWRPRLVWPKLDADLHESPLHLLSEELEAAIGLNPLDWERHLFDHSVDEGERVRSGAPRIDAKNSEATAIVYCRVLVHAWRNLARVHLNAISWDRSVVSNDRLAVGQAALKRPDVMRAEDFVNSRKRQTDLIVAPELAL
jgi:hypothetical protein